MAGRGFQQKLGISYDSKAQSEQVPLLPAEATAAVEVTEVVDAAAVEAKKSVATPAPPELFSVLPVDPRPDILQDSRQWTELLKLAFVKDGEQAEGVFGLVHGIRCCGARIVADPKFRYVLKPGEIGGVEWNGDQNPDSSEPRKSGWRGLLRPYAATLTTWLASLP